MGSHLEDLEGHEGYGARRLPDGTLSTTWSAADRVDAHVAACSCGWRGGAHPGDEEGYEAAVGEWEADHSRPLLAVTVPAEVADAVSAAEQAVAALAGERPAAALRALDDLGRRAERLRRGLGALAAVPEHTRADRPAQPPRRRRSLGR